MNISNEYVINITQLKIIFAESYGLKAALSAEAGKKSLNLSLDAEALKVKIEDTDSSWSIICFLNIHLR